jgi:hypothetical protein
MGSQQQQCAQRWQKRRFDFRLDDDLARDRYLTFQNFVARQTIHFVDFAGLLPGSVLFVPG